MVTRKNNCYKVTSRSIHFFEPIKYLLILRPKNDFWSNNLIFVEELEIILNNITF